MADSHLELPVVDTALEELERTDFAPFHALNDAAMAMTAHVVYSAVDGECLTLSRKGIDEVIRGSIGFDGLLMSDDLSMRALGGSFEERSRRAIEAGCDVVLHGNGALVGEHAGDLMGEFKAIVDAVPELSGRAAERAAEARRQSRRADAFDPGAAEERLASIGLEGRAAA
jgi:beta-N-acetylhexosaminidase